MPAKWFTCPDKQETEITECLNTGCRMKERCAPLPYLHMVSSERVRRYTSARKPILSVTELIRGTMASFLILTTDHAIDPDSRAFAIHGTKAHEKLAVQPATGTVEVRLTSEAEGITGAYDQLTNESGFKLMGDYKTWGSYRIAKALGYGVEMVTTGVLYKSGPRKGESRMAKKPYFDPEARDILDVELQLNMYRVMAEEEGDRVDKLKVFCVVRDGGTWMARSRGIVRNTYYIDIPKLRDDVVLRYFRRKRDALLQALEKGAWDSVCTPSEHWDGIRCARYCDVAKHCPLGRYLMEDKEEMTMPPIAGVTDGPRQLPSLGRIRLGVMVEKNGKTYPKEIDYFRIDPKTESEELSKELVDAFHGKFGEEPKTIHITLPLSDEEAVLNTWYRRYGSGEVLQCKGDGVKATCPTEKFAEGLNITGKEGNKFVVDCNGTDCGYFQAKKCNRRAMLQFLIPSIPGGGTWITSTSSLTSINNILGTLSLLKATAGYFDMVEMILERRKTNITFEGKKTVHYPLFLTVVQSLPELLRMGSVTTAERFSMLALPDDDATDRALESGEKAALEAHVEPPSKEPDAPAEPESKKDLSADYAELITAVAEVMGIDDESFAGFCDTMYPETPNHVAMFGSAAVVDGDARKGIRKALNVWLKKNVQESTNVTLDQLNEINRLAAGIPAYKSKSDLLKMVCEHTGVEYTQLETMSHEHAVMVLKVLSTPADQDDIPGMG